MSRFSSYQTNLPDGVDIAEVNGIEYPIDNQDDEPREREYSPMIRGFKLRANAFRSMREMFPEFGAAECWEMAIGRKAR